MPLITICLSTYHSLCIVNLEAKSVVCTHTKERVFIFSAEPRFQTFEGSLGRGGLAMSIAAFVLYYSHKVHGDRDFRLQKITKKQKILPLFKIYHKQDRSLNIGV